MRKIKINNLTAAVDSVAFYGIDSAEIARIYRELSRENDRNAVIIATSIIDDILSLKIRSLTKVGTAKELKALFSDNGPFGSLYSKVEWLYCIGELQENIRRDINIIRKMRNDAAHMWRAFQLNDDRYIKTMEKMSFFSIVKSVRGFIAQQEGVSLESVQMDQRVCFILMTSLIIALLGNKIAPEHAV
jgi:DNA-binding MltR family transcriptional regulator